MAKHSKPRVCISLGEAEERGQMIPVSAPLPADRGIHRLYGLGEAGQTVVAGDEDIRNTAVLQFSQNVDPEPHPFVLLDTQAQEFLVAVQVDAQGR